MNSENTRRGFLGAAAALGAGLVCAACGGGSSRLPEKRVAESASKGDEHEKGGEVTATENLMREHGVIRRALLLYTAAEKKLRADPSSVSPDALRFHY